MPVSRVRPQWATSRTLYAMAVLVAVVGASLGCQASRQRPALAGMSSLQASRPTAMLEQTRFRDAEVSTVSHTQHSELPPPRAGDLDSLSRWPLSLDEAVRIALEHSEVIRDAGGRVVAMPGGARTRLDPALMTSDPNVGTDAALSAFDTQFESGLFWNGGGRSVGSAFSSGALGMFSQPTTMAKVGLGKMFSTGTRVDFGGVGGYDDSLATGVYAAYGATIRQPLAKRAGREFNQIAGPLGRPGMYRGVWIAQIDADKATFELEQAVRDLVRDVSRTYWELYFAHQNVHAKRVALELARQSWEREQTRVAEQVSPPDAEAQARQQYHTADAAVKNAISGASGVFGGETRLRTLMGLPLIDGRLIQPTTEALTADFRFDWNEALGLAQSRRVELRKQHATLMQRELELKAARNLRRPQVDVVGQYRSLADDPGDDNALFAEALQGWRLGVEYRRPVHNRREKAAVKNAELQLRRDHALLDEQHRQIAAQLRMAFSELDRAFGVMQSMAASRDAAVVRLRAEGERHTAGETHIDTVIESQTRATQAETAYQRSLVDYNIAFVNLHLARGTLLDSLGVGVASWDKSDSTAFAQHRPSVFAEQQRLQVIAETPPRSESR